MTIKIAPMPVYCAGCHQQNPELRHVDFDSALDRGYGKVEAVQISYDDDIHCENCVRRAAELLGMIPGEAWIKEKGDLERKLETERNLRKRAERYSDTLDDLVSQKGLEVDHRKKPRQMKEEPVA